MNANGAVVCIRLLGTWSGEPWRPGLSTLLQVLVSIQGMILCEEPWCNEPGRESQAGSMHSLRYTEHIRHLTIEYALKPWACEVSDSKTGPNSPISLSTG